MVRTGLALSDELGLTTRGVPNLTPRSRAQDVAFLVGLCRDHEVGDVAVGLPMLPSGDDTPMTRRARGFAATLEAGLREAGLETRVHLVDERGTSKAAAEKGRSIASASTHSTGSEARRDFSTPRSSIGRQKSLPTTRTLGPALRA